MTASLAIESGLGTALHTGDLAFVADVVTDPRVKFRCNELTAARSGAWLPVVRDGRGVAVMAISWNAPRRELSERERGMLQLLAAELARYGGEEFAVLLPHSDEAGAMAVVERLLEVMPLGQTASAGVAVWDGTEDATQLLARADVALYKAKGAGRNRAHLAVE